MVKTRIDITIDKDVHEQCRSMDLNISAVVNRFLTTLTSVGDESNPDVESIALLEKKYQFAQQDFIKSKAELDLLNRSLEAMKQKQKLIELQKIKEAEERLEQSKPKCIVCSKKFLNTDPESVGKLGSAFYCKIHPLDVAYKKAQDLNIIEKRIVSTASLSSEPALNVGTAPEVAKPSDVKLSPFMKRLAQDFKEEKPMQSAIDLCSEYMSCPKNEAKSFIDSKIREGFFRESKPGHLQVNVQ